MSYKHIPKEDSLNDYFSRLTDFVVIAPNLLKANSRMEFEVWLEKCELIDRRALYYYLKKNKDIIKPEFMKIAQKRFIEDLTQPTKLPADNSHR